MESAPQQCVRALLVAPDWSVLLMRIRGSRREIWVTPGGRIEEGESAEAALRREIREETGVALDGIGPDIWWRAGRFDYQGRRIAEEERIFLVRTERFEPCTAAMTGEERAVFREFRWWTIEALAVSDEQFVPPRIAELLEKLRREGPAGWITDVSG